MPASVNPSADMYTRRPHREPRTPRRNCCTPPTHCKRCTTKPHCRLGCTSTAVDPAAVPARCRQPTDAPVPRPTAPNSSTATGCITHASSIASPSASARSCCTARYFSLRGPGPPTVRFRNAANGWLASLPGSLCSASTARRQLRSISSCRSTCSSRRKRRTRDTHVRGSTHAGYWGGRQGSCSIAPVRVCCLESTAGTHPHTHKACEAIEPVSTGQGRPHTLGQQAAVSARARAREHAFVPPSLPHTTHHTLPSHLLLDGVALDLLRESLLQRLHQLVQLSQHNVGATCTRCAADTQQDTPQELWFIGSLAQVCCQHTRYMEAWGTLKVWCVG